MMPKRIDALIIAATLAVFVLIFARVVSSNRFGYDESDYMYAISKGIRANYLDEPTIPITTFISKGLQGVRGRISSDSLAEFIRASDDINFYRHYHAPLSFYWVIANRSILGDREGLIRWSSLFCLMLGFAVIYMGCISLWGARGRVAAVVASSLFLLSPTNIATAVRLGPHSLYVLLSIATLFAISKLIIKPNKTHFYVVTLLLCLSTLTLEYAILLMLTFVACIVFCRKELSFSCSRSEVISSVVRAAVLFLLVFVLVWPAGLFKASIIKNYTFFAYFTLKRSDAYGSAPFYQVWLWRFLSSPVEYLLIFGAVGWLVVARARGRMEWWTVPFSIFAALVFATTVRNKSTSPTYVSSLLPPLHVLAGAAVVRAAGRRLSQQVAVGAIVLLAALASNYINFLSARSPGTSPTPADRLVDFYRENPVATKRILVPRALLPTLHYYFPDGRFVAYGKAGASRSVIEPPAQDAADEVILVGDGQNDEDSQMRLRGWLPIKTLGPVGAEESITIYATEADQK
jgi:hypothetical protein